jgi:dTDP-4-dehydrorhamnose reductase
MKILITGANGFLGFYLTELLLQKNYTVIATGKGGCRLPFTADDHFLYESMDFTDTGAVQTVFEKHHPEVVVHAGAMTRADDCELQQQLAYTYNVEGTGHMLKVAASHQCFFIFISTDFIFDGKKESYTETDTANPVNFYGGTKMKAETAVKEYPFDWAIVRTVLVYGKPATGRHNILTIVKEKLEKGEEYKVVNDQLRTPTFVMDLAKGIAALIEKKATGIYHLAGRDTLTPYEMACKTAGYLGLDKNLLKKVTAADFTQPALRPACTRFDIHKAEKELGYTPVSFEEGLKKTFS